MIQTVLKCDGFTVKVWGYGQGEKIKRSWRALRAMIYTSGNKPPESALEFFRRGGSLHSYDILNNSEITQSGWYLFIADGREKEIWMLITPIFGGGYYLDGKPVYELPAGTYKYMGA